jgi:type I restriction enzyme M protein
MPSSPPSARSWTTPWSPSNATTRASKASCPRITPASYVGAEAIEDDGDPFEEKMPRLVAELESQFVESEKLEAAIRANLKSLNFTP